MYAVENNIVKYKLNVHYSIQFKHIFLIYEIAIRINNYISSKQLYFVQTLFKFHREKVIFKIKCVVISPIVL